MIRSIRLEQFQSSAECKSYVYQSRESFLQCSCRLLPGNSYGVISDFGYGGWGLVTCIGGRGLEAASGNCRSADGCGVWQMLYVSVYRRNRSMPC